MDESDIVTGIRNRSTDELLRMLQDDPADYLPSVWDAACEEIRSRGLELPQRATQERGLRAVLADLRPKEIGRNITAEDLVGRFRGEAIHVQACIENTFADTGQVSLNTSLGDLFLTPEGLVYLSYGTFMYPGGPGAALHGSGGLAAGALGFLVGGFPGAIAGGTQLRQALAEATKAANDARAADFGLPLSERIRRHGARFIGRTEMKDIEAFQDGAEVRVTVGDVEVCLVASPAARLFETVQRWLDGSLDEKRDCLRISRERFPVSKLLATLETGSLADVKGSDALVTLSSDNVYLAALLRSFENLPSRTQHRIIRHATMLPEGILAPLRSHLAARKKLTTRKLHLALLGEIPGLLGAGYLLVNHHRDFKELGAWGPLSSLALFALFFLLPLTVYLAVRRHREEALCALLNS